MKHLEKVINFHQAEVLSSKEIDHKTNFDECELFGDFSIILIFNVFTSIEGYIHCLKLIDFRQ